MAVVWEKDFMDVLGHKGLFLDEETRNKLSRDYFWYSPVLNEQLRDKKADGIVIPGTEDEVRDILSCACKYRIPVTVRGAGTGNYGQAVPLDGGVVMDLSRLNRIIETGDGYARVQCGVRLGTLEKHLRKEGRELCIYPSTYAKATVGGFVSGGSGGIGSITWGNLWDGNVLEAVVYTMEETPRRLVARGDDLLAYIHSYGTTGVVTELKIRIAPRTEWTQTVVQFPEFEAAMSFSEKISANPAVRKRLVSTHEWPIPSYFLPLARYIGEGCSVVLLETEDGTLPTITELADAYDGEVRHVIPAENYHKKMGLSDFTWNHTTLWALKKDPSLTYLQAGFSLERYGEQIAAIKRNYPDEVLLHFEWMMNGGKLTPASLPVVRYKNKDRLYEIISFFESVGVRINDPHTFLLDYGSRGQYERMREQKRLNDPYGLLNPGKINDQTG